MTKAEKVTVGAACVLAVCFVVAYAGGRREGVGSAPVLLNGVYSPEVIGKSPAFLEGGTAPYTLVEFGDYQCPPCRAVNKEIPELLQPYQGKVGFEFRNLPLTKIHAYAMAGAVAAETAKEQGAFWRMHDLLYQGDALDNGRIERAESALSGSGVSFDQARTLQAQAAVAADIAEAKKLDLPGTPSFLLCLPNRSVLRLRTLDSLRASVR